MAKEDILLPMKMGKLKIEAIKINNNVTYENPFLHSTKQKSFFTRTFKPASNCSCSFSKNSNRSIAICKKKHNKILKEPVLKLLQSYNKKHDKVIDSAHTLTEHSQSSQIIGPDSLSFLVDNCNQLKISTGSSQRSASGRVSKDNKWWNKSIAHTSKATQNKQSVVEKTRSGPSCSQEALNPPCDVTIDELASYFETFVHIPKKMSSMAEMMYI